LGKGHSFAELRPFFDGNACGKNVLQ